MNVFALYNQNKSGQNVANNPQAASSLVQGGAGIAGIGGSGGAQGSDGYQIGHGIGTLLGTTGGSSSGSGSSVDWNDPVNWQIQEENDYEANPDAADVASASGGGTGGMGSMASIAMAFL